MGKLLTTTLFLFILFTGPVSAQYYYKDVLSNKQLVADMAVYKAHKITTIKVNSFDADQSPSKGFFCEKKINKDYRKMDTYTRSFVTNKSILTTSFNAKGLLIKSVDSTDVNSATSEYTYDDAGNLINITSYSRSSDDDFTTALLEVRQYSYNDKGQPEKMLRIKNQKDTTEFDFTLDEKGNVTEEIEVAVYGNHYYYYYDTQNRLTDIVRFNIVKQKPIPDFMFEYNTDNQIEKMVVTQEVTNCALKKNAFQKKVIC
jgi:YD repeat-containing protein